MRRDAPAKINLHLRVLGPRNDGYHDVQSLLQTIDMVDEVRATPAPPDVLELQVHPAGLVSSGGDNLVLRAAEALRRSTGVHAGARLELMKRIPIGSGLGGGSSDAAATLSLLDTLWDLHLDLPVLVELAAELGSDVPFFLFGGLALVTGRGEDVQPLPDVADLGVIVCSPPIEIATAGVYRRFAARSRLTSRGPKGTVGAFAEGLFEADSFTPRWNGLGNDLEQVVIDEWPEVGRALAALEAAGPLHAAISGSGSAVFGVFPDIDAARNGAVGLDERWRIFVGSTVGRERASVGEIAEGREEGLV